MTEPSAQPEEPARRSHDDDDFIDSRMRNMQRTDDMPHTSDMPHRSPMPQMPAEPVRPPFPMPGHVPRKSKWVAALLSMFIPGTGHLYLGLVPRGIKVMLLLILDIASIVFFSAGPVEFNILLVTLLSLLIPVIYFYNIFDAVHRTDWVNRAYAAAFMPNGEFGRPAPVLDNADQPLLWLLLAGGFFFLVAANGNWLASFFAIPNAYAAVALLLIAGVAMYIMEARKK